MWGKGSTISSGQNENNPPPISVGRKESMGQFGEYHLSYLEVPTPIHPYKEHVNTSNITRDAGAHPTQYQALKSSRHGSGMLVMSDRNARSGQELNLHLEAHKNSLKPSRRR